MAAHLHIVDIFNEERYHYEALEAGSYLGEPLMERWPEGVGCPFKLYQNTLCEESEIDTDVLLDLRVQDNDVYYFVVYPAGDPVSAAIAIVAVIIAILAVVLIPDPKLPEKADDPNKSNSLSGQTNEIREGERVLEVFGTIKVYPDLIAQSVTYWAREYSATGLDPQTIEEVLCLGIGYHEDLTSNLDKVFIGDTRMSDLEAGSYEFEQYNPGERPSVLVDFRTASEVDDQKLPAIAADGTDERVTTNVNVDVTLSILEVKSYSAGVSINEWAGVGDTIQLVNAGGNDGIYTILLVEIVFTTGAPGSSYPSGWKYTLSPLMVTDGDFSSVTILNPTGAQDNVVGPFVVPGTPDEIWIDFRAPRGIASKLNEELDININVFVEEIDASGSPLGPNFNAVFVLGGDNYDERNWTKVIDESPTFPSFTKGKRWRVSCENTSLELTNSDSAQEIRWTRLGSYREIASSFTGFRDVTTLYLKLVGTDLASSIQDRRTNMITTRLLPTYGTVEDFAPGTPRVGSSTTRGLDALYYMLTNKYGSNLEAADVDISSFDEVNSQIGGTNLMPFNAVLSNRRSSDDDIVTIANAMRSFVYRDGQQVSVIYDNANKTPTALFNRRNKSTRGDVHKLGFGLSNAQDGVELRYLEETQDYIERTISLPDGQLLLNPKKLELVGATNWEQAWRRARYEQLKLELQWDSMQIEVTDEGWFAKPNTMILNANNVVSTTYDGNVVDITGTTWTLSNAVSFADVTAPVLTVRNLTGEQVETVAVSEIVGQPHKVTVATPPSFPVTGSRNEDGMQIGSLYWFGDDNDTQTIEEWVVSKVSPSDKYTKIELNVYDPNVYDGDTEPLPPLPPSVGEARVVNK